MRSRKNLVTGLTGGMGCGKSTAAQMFAECGFRLFDSDATIHNDLYKRPSVVAAVAARLGADVLDGDGRVRRSAIASKVFSDDSCLAWIEGLLHPLLIEEWGRAFSEGSGNAWIVEVPLLFEKQLENWFDFTVCVTADSANQLRRLEKRGLGPDLARQRLAKQMPLAKKCELADFVLLNDGSIEFLRGQVVELAAQILNKKPGPRSSAA